MLHGPADIYRFVHASIYIQRAHIQPDTIVSQFPGLHTRTPKTEDISKSVLRT